MLMINNAIYFFLLIFVYAFQSN